MVSTMSDGWKFEQVTFGKVFFRRPNPPSLRESRALDDVGLALCSDWLLQLVSVGYGRAQKSEFLLIVSREVMGEESVHPAKRGEVCPTILSGLPPITACPAPSKRRTFIFLFFFTVVSV